jgi:hypothetical protein
MPPSITVAAPAAQGDGVTGMQGIGVSTPNAAAVADATSGLAIEAHIPKGMMFTSGSFAEMFASGCSLVLTRVTGSTTRVLGANPNEH